MAAAASAIPRGTPPDMDVVDLSLLMPIWLAGIAVVGGCVLLTLATYLLARSLLLPILHDDSHDLAGSIVFRISALHGLILALVFAQELVNANGLRATAAREATLAGNIYYDLGRYGGPDTPEIQRQVALYVMTVAEAEWEALGRGEPLLEDAWGHWRAAYESILALEPVSLRQTSLRDTMLASAREISGLRNKRELSASTGIDPLFWVAALIGVLLTAVSYFPFAPKAVNLVLLSAMSAYTGIVIFFILAFANPYSGAGAISPDMFEKRLERGLARSLGEG